MKLSAVVPLLSLALAACGTTQASEPAPVPPVVPYTATSAINRSLLCWDVPTSTGWLTVTGSPSSLPAHYWGPQHMPTYINARNCGATPPRRLYVPLDGDPHPETLCQRVMSAAASAGHPLDFCKVVE